MIKSTIVWVIGSEGSLGASLKGSEGSTKVSGGHLPAAGKWGITPALGVLWTLRSHCLTWKRRKEKSRKQKHNTESFKWQKKSSQEAGCLHFVSIYGTQSLNRALHSEFIWLLKLPPKFLSARKPAAFKSFPVVSLYLEMFHVGLIHWSILPCQNREWSVKNRMKLISGTAGDNTIEGRINRLPWNKEMRANSGSKGK